MGPKTGVIESSIVAVIYKGPSINSYVLSTFRNNISSVQALLAAAQNTGTSGDPEWDACGMAMRAAAAVALLSFFNVRSTLRFIEKSD